MYSSMECSFDMVFYCPQLVFWFIRTYYGFCKNQKLLLLLGCREFAQRVARLYCPEQKRKGSHECTSLANKALAQTCVTNKVKVYMYSWKPFLYRLGCTSCRRWHLLHPLVFMWEDKQRRKNFPHIYSNFLTSFFVSRTRVGSDVSSNGNDIFKITVQ